MNFGRVLSAAAWPLAVALAVGAVLVAAFTARPSQWPTDPATAEQLLQARASSACADEAIRRQADRYQASPIAIGTVRNIVEACDLRAAQAEGLK